MKHLISALILTAALCLPVSAQSYDLTKILGTYVSSAPQDFLYVKNLTISRDDKGNVKFRATLSGFPDDIYLGEVTADSYQSRTADVYRNYVSNFSAGKVSVCMATSTSASNPTQISVTSYIKYIDGSKPNVFIEGGLQKQTD